MLRQPCRCCRVVAAAACFRRRRNRRRRCRARAAVHSRRRRLRRLCRGRRVVIASAEAGVSSSLLLSSSLAALLQPSHRRRAAPAFAAAAASLVANVAGNVAVAAGDLSSLPPSWSWSAGAIAIAPSFPSPSSSARCGAGAVVIRPPLASKICCRRWHYSTAGIPPLRSPSAWLAAIWQRSCTIGGRRQGELSLLRRAENCHWRRGAGTRKSAYAHGRRFPQTGVWR